MRKSTWIVLGAFLALLIGAIALVTQKHERGITRLSLTVDKDQIDRLVITGKNPVELAREGEGEAAVWKLPNGRLADATSVRRLTEGLAKLESSDMVTDEDAKFAELEVTEELGSKVTAYARGKQLTSIIVGKTTGVITNVRVGDQVFKVRGLTSSVVSKALSAWTERKLFTDKVDEVTRLEVKLAGQTPYALVKQDGAWQVEDPALLPKGFRFDPEAARALVTGVVSARAKDFEDQDPGADKTGLDDAKADVFTFTVTPAPAPTEAEAPKADDKAPTAGAKAEGASKDPAAAKPEAVAAAPAAPVAPPVSRSLRLGAPKEGAKDVYARADGRPDLFTLAEGTAKNLRKALLDLRDMKLVKLEKDKVQKLTIFDGKNTLVFEKKDGAWAVAKSTEPTPQGFELDPMAVDRRLMAMANAKGTRLVTDKANAGLSSPSAKVTAALEGGATVTLAFGKDTKDDDKEVVYAQGNADGEAYFVTKWTRQNLTGGLASFKKQAEGGPQLDPQAMSGLPPEVRDQLMRQMKGQARERELLKNLQGKMPPRPPSPK